MGESIKPIETKYRHNYNTREYQLFPEEFFSGSQVSIFFGHKFIANCMGFSFSLQEQLKPIYGYASRQFDEMAIGNRIVIGSFQLGFKEAGELNAILNEIETYKQDTNDATKYFTEGENVPAWMGSMYSPELLLGMSMTNDPNIKDTDIKVIKVYFKGDRVFYPPEIPAMLRQAEDGQYYTFVPFRFTLNAIGFPNENSRMIENGVYQFLSKDNKDNFTIDTINHTVTFNGKNIVQKDGRPLMTFDFEDRQYVHVRTLCEAAGYTVNWDASNYTVNIT